MLHRLAVATLAALCLAGCAQTVAQRTSRHPMRALRPVALKPVALKPVALKPVVLKPGVPEPIALKPADTHFAQAGDGTVIPDFRPDADAIAFASRCGQRGPSAVALGMRECDLVAAKGTPSRVVSGLDQSGHTHNAIWYLENGARRVYKFDDNHLTTIID